jgi:predicted AlkP superfamily pyrophosphatase or phosphodiesterase
MTSAVESGLIWLSLTSRVWTTTVSPLSTVITGALPASHVKWTWSLGK